MTIDWSAFLLVVAVSLLAAVTVVALFAAGIRLFATPRGAPPPSATPRDEEFDDVPRGSRPRAATAGGLVAFILSGAVALLGVLLIVAR